MPIRLITHLSHMVDEIEYVAGKSPEKVLIGGAGTYAAIGARLVAGERYANSVGWIVDVGADFPPEFRSTIEAWGTACRFREDRNRLTTRAWNGYSGENEHRGRDLKFGQIERITLTNKVIPAFRYLTPKLRLDQDSLSSAQLLANSFHFVCSSERCISLVQGISHRGKDIQPALQERRKSQERSLMIWEPVPELCIPEERAKFKEAIQYVDVVSPNVEEFAGFFTSERPVWSEERAAEAVLAWGIGPHENGALVIRQGSQGCTAYLRECRFHLRPYHLDNTGQQKLRSKAVDPTGGGNAFLGALAFAMNGKVTPSMSGLDSIIGQRKRHRRLFGAMVYATIAASFVIEQPGMPLLSGKAELQCWNGEPFEKRLMTYLSREHDYIARQMTNEDDPV